MYGVWWALLLLPLPRILGIFENLVLLIYPTLGSNYIAYFFFLLLQ
jgi:hypothetical protein